MSLVDDNELTQTRGALRVTGLSQRSLYRKVAEDSTFPQPIRILNRNCWRVRDLLRWVEEQAARPPAPRNLDRPAAPSAEVP